MSKEEQELQAFYLSWAEYHKANPAQRRGQALFNHLHDVRTDLAERIRGTNLDPFYDDSRLDDTLTWLHQQWIPLRA